MANDPGITSVDFNCSPALSNDQKTLYVAVNSGDFSAGYLLALDSTTLVQTARVLLLDPKSGSAAQLPDIRRLHPSFGTDGDVYFGVFENPFPENNDRGWLLHFSADLSQEKTPGFRLGQHPQHRAGEHGAELPRDLNVLADGQVQQL